MKSDRMGTVALEGLEFFAYHGYYEEERTIGNRYAVDITVSADFSEAAQNDRLRSTINYEDLYRIVKEEMAVPSRLLEHIAQRIIKRTYERYPNVEWVEVGLSKFNTPLGGVCHRSRITLRQ